MRQVVPRTAVQWTLRPSRAVRAIPRTPAVRGRVFAARKPLPGGTCRGLSTIALAEEDATSSAAYSGAMDSPAVQGGSRDPPDARCTRAGFRSAKTATRWNLSRLVHHSLGGGGCDK